jgi:GntR family transcriptional regulator, phosphonate transport system regulatory protein
MIGDPAKDALAVPRGRGVALWRQVAARLAEEIGSQPPKGDQRLPSEQELARRFGVNRHTVRQAIRSLAEQGLVRAEQGRGTFIAGQPVDYPLGPRTRLTATLEAQDRAPHREILACERLAADAPSARLLELRVSAPVFAIRSLTFADGVPISTSRLLLPAERFPAAAERLATDSSITRLYASHGIDDYRRRSTRLFSRLPEVQEALMLRQDAHLPVLITEGLDIDLAMRPIGWSVTVWAAERVQFLVES